MRDGGFSRPRLGRMHEVMAGYVERGELPALVALARPPTVCRDFWTSAYQALAD